MVLEVLVLAENNMIKLEDIKIGVVVRKHNYKTTTYTITDVNSKIIINDKAYRSICYAPNDDNNYTRFARDIDSFLSNFEIVL